MKLRHVKIEKGTLKRIKPLRNLYKLQNFEIFVFKLLLFGTKGGKENVSYVGEAENAAHLTDKS